MSRFTDWWNRSKIKHDQEQADILNKISKISTQVDNLIEDKKQLEQDLEAANAELSVFRTQEQDHDRRKNSDEPWVEIKSDSIDPDKGIQIGLDWNDNFIEYLKSNGLTGKSDEVIVQKWIALLYHDLINNLDQKIIDDSDIIGPSEFE